jgi:hypothetical protein
MSGMNWQGGPRDPRDPREHAERMGQTAEDPFLTWDGAYVLGALSPQDRAAYEAHLRVCGDCARAVRELAGMPGLLGQAQAVARSPQGNAGPPPADLLPALLGRVASERRRQRRRAMLPGVGLALAACLALLFVLVAPFGGDDDEGGSTGESIAMTSLVDYPVSATVSLTDAAWGTRVDMECVYGADSSNDYVLVAITRDGEDVQLASWGTIRDRDVTFSVGTELHAADIETLEVRSTHGYPVLRADLSG